MSRDCSGYGECISQNDDGIRVEDANCPHKCKVKKCANSLLCGEVSLPERLILCKRGCCVNCDMTFAGALEFKEKEDEECSICYEGDGGGVMVKMQRCNHWFCVVCFRRLHWREINDDDEDDEDCPDGRCPLCREKKVKH